MKKEPSALDSRAAKLFQELANKTWFPVSCRFRRIVRQNDHIEHLYWRVGAEEFKSHFGQGANYFAGALEYVRRSTGWKFPYNHLSVVVLAEKGSKTSGGCALIPLGTINVVWADGEFTTTVFHELIHMFKRTNEGKAFGPTKADEKWIEQQALELTMEI